MKRHLDDDGPEATPHAVAVTGASGLIGRALIDLLEARGHRAIRLVRREPTLPDEARWDPMRGEVDAAALEGLDGVIHLAGESVAGGRWSAERKDAIWSSRVEGTRALCEALARARRRPRYLICASAIGYYGDRGDEPLDERSAAGEGFLADVCRAWEEATRPARAAGIRVVHLRVGIVLARTGGALAKMLTPFKLGAGGRVGTGRQWMSWISLADVVRAIHHVMLADDVHGPVNAVAPQPVTQRDFATALGRVLRRPTIAPLPGIAVKALFGEMGRELLLAGQRVRPTRLLEGGFDFADPELEGALRRVLGLPSAEPASPTRPQPRPTTTAG